MIVEFYPSRETMLEIIEKSYPESFSSGIKLIAAIGSDQQVRTIWNSLQERIQHSKEIDRKLGIRR